MNPFLFILITYLLIGVLSAKLINKKFYKLDDSVESETLMAVLAWPLALMILVCALAYKWIKKE